MPKAPQSIFRITLRSVPKSVMRVEGYLNKINDSVGLDEIAMHKLKPLRRGQIVNIASQAGKTGFPGGATYCATKFAVVGLSEAVRNELHGTGVGVTCVMPGVVDTRLGAGLSQPGFVELVTPQEVADGIVRGIVEDRPEIWLPKMTRAMIPVIQLLPAKVRDRLSRALGTDKTLGAPTREGGAEYELSRIHI